MSRSLSEEQVLKKLGISDFRHLSKDNLMSFVSLIDKVDPEVAKKAIEQFPDFAQASLETLTEMKEASTKVLDDDKESANRFYDMCDEIIGAIKLSMSSENISFEEKKYYIDKMQEIATIAAEKDSEGKKFKWAALATFASVAISVVAAAASLLGGNLNINPPGGKD